jgi:hypothetical protein
MVPTDIRNDGAMSELRHSRRFGHVRVSSALSPIEDILRPPAQFRWVAKSRVVHCSNRRLKFITMPPSLRGLFEA